MAELNALPEYVTPDYLANLELCKGVGSGEKGECCAIQERRRWDGLNSESDEIPTTDSYVVGRLIISINDSSGVWRSKLGPYLLKLRGSGRKDDKRRALRMADWALREVLPDAIDTCAKICDSETTRDLSARAEELRGYAKQLRDSEPIADLAALAARAARAAAEEAYWPKIAALLDDLLA